MSATPETSVPLPVLLSTAELAEMLGMTDRNVRLMRSEGVGPPFIKISARIVRYDRDAVMAWMHSRTRGGDDA